MFPPMLLYMRLESPQRRGFGMWLPLFLVWLILLPIVVLAALTAALADAALFLGGASYHHYTLLLLRCLSVLGALRGTVVHVHSAETVVEIDLV